MSCHRPVLADLAVVLTGRAERLVELLHQVDELEVRRCVERVVVAHQCQRHAHDREEASAAGVVDRRHILRELLGVEERRDRHGFLGLLVDHDRHADAAVRVTAAGEVAPLRVGSVDAYPPSR